MQMELILIILSFSFIVQILVSTIFKVSVIKKIYKLFNFSLLVDTLFVVVFVVIYNNKHVLLINQLMLFSIFMGMTFFHLVYVSVINNEKLLNKTKLPIVILTIIMIFVGPIIGELWFVIILMLVCGIAFFTSIYTIKHQSKRMGTLNFLLSFTEIIRYIIVGTVIFQIIFEKENNYVWLITISYNMRTIVVLIVSELLGYIGLNQNIINAFDFQGPAHLLNLSFEKNPNVIVLTDLNERIVYANPASLELTGYKERELIGKKPSVFASGQTDHTVYESLHKALLKSEDWTGEFINKKKNGEIFIEHAKIVTLRDVNNLPLYYLAIKTDVTKERNYLQELEYKSNYDSLTGLLQRSKFLSLIEEKRKAKPDNENYLMLIDINEFKKINDLHGHLIGDNALIHFADIFDEIINPYGYVCRFGGDEFAAFVSNVSKTKVYEIIEKIHKSLKLHPYAIINGNNEFLAVSIGVIEYKNELAFNEAYVFADKCLYKAKAIKNKGENTFSNFDGECDV